MNNSSHNCRRNVFILIGAILNFLPLVLKCSGNYMSRADEN